MRSGSGRERLPRTAAAPGWSLQESRAGRAAAAGEAGLERRLASGEPALCLSAAGAEACEPSPTMRTRGDARLTRGDHTLHAGAIARRAITFARATRRRALAGVETVVQILDAGRPSCP